jgi:hypothetical protein
MNLDQGDGENSFDPKRHRAGALQDASETPAPSLGAPRLGRHQVLKLLWFFAEPLKILGGAIENR